MAETMGDPPTAAPIGSTYGYNLRAPPPHGGRADYGYNYRYGANGYVARYDRHERREPREGYGGHDVARWRGHGWR